MVQAAASPSPAAPSAPTDAAPKPPADISVPDVHPCFYPMCRGIARLITTPMFRLKSRGVSNIPKTGGALLVCNHQSMLDPVLFGVHLPRKLNFVAKAELFEKHKAFTWLIRSLGALPLHRGQADLAAMRETINRLKSGMLVTLFPEGTRTLDGEVRPLQPGVGLLVKRAQVPIIPAVVDGSFEALPPNARYPRPHPIRLLYGPPLPIDGLKPDQIVPLLDKTLRGMLTTLRALPNE